MSATTTSMPANLGAALLTLMIQSRGAQTEASQNEIEHADRLVEQARKDIAEALERAAEARESAGFWGALSSVFEGDVAALCGVIAAAAAVVATGGAGAPAVAALAAAGLSTASKVGGELGMPPLACKLLGAAGALAGLATGNLSAASGAWSTVATTASAAQAGAPVAAGVASTIEGQYEAASLHARADARAAEGNEEDALLRIDLAIGVIERAAKDLAHGQSGAARIVDSHHQSRAAIITRIGGSS